MKLNRNQKKELLLLKGEALRLQLTLDIHESRESLKPARLFWRVLDWRSNFKLVHSVLGKQKSTLLKTVVTVMLATVFFLKKRG